MSRAGWLPWFLLAVWSTWICALQGLLLGQAVLAPWIPDAWLVLLIALSSRLERRDLPKVALAVAAGRIAVSIEPAPAVLAAALGLVLVVRALRSVIEVGDVAGRTLLALVGALAYGRWEALALESRALAGSALHAPRLAESWEAALDPWGPHALQRAAATALFALVFGPSLAHLPGLTPLRRRTTWHPAASARSW